MPTERQLDIILESELEFKLHNMTDNERLYYNGMQALQTALNDIDAILLKRAKEVGLNELPEGRSDLLTLLLSPPSPSPVEVDSLKEVPADIQKASAYCTDNNCSLSDLADAHYRMNNERLLDKEASNIIRSAAKQIASAGETMRWVKRPIDLSEIMKDYKQLKDYKQFLGGKDIEWSIENLPVGKQETLHILQGYEQMIKELDGFLYAYENGASQWKERALAAERALSAHKNKETAWVNLAQQPPCPVEDWQDWHGYHMRYASDKFHLPLHLFEVRHGGLCKIGGTGRLEFSEVEWLSESASPSDTREEAIKVTDFIHFAHEWGWYDSGTLLWEAFEENVDPFRRTTSELYDLYTQSLNK